MTQEPTASGVERRLTATHCGLRGLTLIALGLLLGPGLQGCTDDIVEPNCDSKLKLVLHGTLDDQDLEEEHTTVGGRWLDKRFYVVLDEPLQGDGYWVLEFGYNPLARDDDVELAQTVTLANEMLRSGVERFALRYEMATRAGDGSMNRCDPSAGELCAGLGMYAAGQFDPSQDVAGPSHFRSYDHYLPVKSGELVIEKLLSSGIKARYELELDWDLSGAALGEGTLNGCIKASRVKGGGDGDLLN